MVNGIHIYIYIYIQMYIYIKGPLKVDYDILNGTLKGVLDGILKVYEMVYWSYITCILSGKLKTF